MAPGWIDDDPTWGLHACPAIYSRAPDPDSITRVPYTLNGGDYSIFANAINGNGPGTLLEHYAMVDHHAPGQMQFDDALSGVVVDEHGHTHDD